MTRRIVDAHVHCFQKGQLPPRWFSSIEERWSGSTWPHRDASALGVEAGLVDPGAELLVAELEGAGVQAAVCMNLDWGVALGEAEVSPREIHELYAGWQQTMPGRFFAVVGVDPRRPDALDVVRRGVVDLGLKAVKLYPPCGYFADDPVCHPVYELCLELGVPVVLHTAFIGYPHRGYYADPARVSGVQHLYPELRIVLAHSGFEFWIEEAIAVAAAHPHTYLELSNWNELIAKDRARLDQVLQLMIREVGAHKMLFASDYLGGRRQSGKGKIAEWVEYISKLEDLSSGAISTE
jgi:predicted TIM-barrel fold metal-dependent hydrolase